MKSLKAVTVCSVLAVMFTATTTTQAVEVVDFTGGVVDRTILDSGSGELFMMWEKNGVSSQFTVNDTVKQWSFYSDGVTAGDPPAEVNGGAFITPLIFQHTGGDNFNLTGIGTARANDDSGLQTFAFDLVAGSANVGLGYYFGWVDGDQDGVGGANTFNTGVAEWDFNTVDGLRRLGGGGDVAAVLNSTYNTNYFMAPNGTDPNQGRSYSVSATTLPEPASLALLGLGGLLMIRRRRMA